MKKLLTTGTVLIIIGLLFVITQNGLSVLMILGLGIELIGVSLVIIQKVKTNQLSKLRPALISLALIVLILITYFFVIY